LAIVEKAAQELPSQLSGISISGARVLFNGDARLTLAL
jgi:hypothetical protein